MTLGTVFPRKTKIVATLGPKSNTYETIEALHDAGANFYRLNFSHGSHEEHQALYDIIHQMRVARNAPDGVLADMSGPKHRIGIFEKAPGSPPNKPGAVLLKAGQDFRFDLDTTPGDASRVCLPDPLVVNAMKVGDRFLLDDGNIQMRVVEKGDKFFVARMLNRSDMILSDRKGFNIPDLSIHLPAITEKDKRDAEFALNLGVDWIAFSFVQNADDIRQARALVDGRAKIIAKIETPAALRNFGEILELSDGVMVARGDLAVELAFEHVPIAQRHIIDSGRVAGKPVIVATQMAESMIKNPSPTRAEANDISVAVAQGASAVMLSGETANGNYPVEAVEAMALIARSREDFMRDPQAYLSRIFGDATLYSETAGANLPPPAQLTTWQDRRQLGDSRVLWHLRSSSSGGVESVVVLNGGGRNGNGHHVVVHS